MARSCSASAGCSRLLPWWCPCTSASRPSLVSPWRPPPWAWSWLARFSTSSAGPGRGAPSGPLLLVPDPLPERDRPDAPARFQRRDVGVVADGVEPLEHLREVVAVGAYRRDRDRLVGDGLSRQLAEGRRRLGHRDRVAR